MPKSLNKLFISIVIFLLLIGLVALSLVYEDVRNKTILQYGEILNIYTNKSAETLESFIIEYKNDLEFSTSLNEIIHFDENGKKILENFYNSQKDKIAAITRIDENGKIIYSLPYTSEIIGKDVSNQEHNKKVMETHKPVISDIFLAVQGFHSIALAYPIFDESNNYLGTLSTLIPFKYVSEKFVSDVHFDKSINVNLISNSGILIYSDKPNQIGKDVSEIKNSKLAQEIIKSQQKNKNGKGIFQSQKGDFVYAYSTTNLFDNYWIVILTAPVETALENMQNFQTKYVMIILSFGAAILFSSIIFFRIRKRYEQDNYEKQLFFNLVAERTGQIIYDYNYSDGSIKWAGAINELTGFTKDDFLNFEITDWKKLIHIDDISLINHFEKIEISKKYQRIQYRIKKSTGEFIYVEDSNVIMEDSKKHSLRIIGTIKDIHDQKEIESKLIRNKEELESLVKQRTQELEKLNKSLEDDIEDRKNRETELRIAKDKAVAADKIKSDFLAQISHEIRTPISAILNFTQFLFDEFEDKENEIFKTAYNSINSAGKRMIRTIDLILNVSEVQSKSYDYNPGNFDVYSDSLFPLANEFKAAADNKNISMEIIKESDDLIINRDIYSVTQIFANLIDNAIKYTKEGSIKIIVGRNENVFVKIQDTGIGISDEFIPKLFEPFTQEETGYTRKFDGTGLGMALVNKYCELNNLKISVESKKNEGTTFTINF